MSCQLHKALQRYYKRLHSFYDEWLIIGKKIEISLTALNDQSETLQLISDDADYNDAEISEELQHRIRFNILMVLDEEQDHLFKIMVQFNRVIQELANLLQNVIRARSKVFVRDNDEEMKLLINGSYCRPKLDLLMEWAIKSFEYFNNLYYCINNEIKLLGYDKMKNTDKVLAAIKKANEGRIAINKILAHTQYMIDEQFPNVKHKNTGLQKIPDPTLSQSGTERRS
ncbi:PREDICTED: uncharacterized protein LOC106748957 [Dinoponera quadriceps]|uniref:Uncharacterized protein LOC106748957 n=1 Tax=Dinoponera quadriceps TaxID=609295 RepID=A0A6P3XZK4_DINQU|nr:PREDICTED: uncharacterized protein LOC106748957 [Dinoponera quadriceps]